MSEIKRKPYLVEVAAEQYAAFDEDHTLADFVRYLLTQTSREELQQLVMESDHEGQAQSRS